jgi:hypothetical protein
MRLLLIVPFLFSLLSADSGILDIKWPKPNVKHQKPSTPYPSVLTEGIKNVKLPVYIPNSYAYDKNMIVVSDKNFYTISFLFKGATIMISGDKTFQESVSNNPEFKAILKATPPVTFEQEEGIMTAEFNRHGVNYSMAIECDNPKTDERCKETKLIKDLYNRLIMVGGRP